MKADLGVEEAYHHGVGNSAAEAFKLSREQTLAELVAAAMLHESSTADQIGALSSMFPTANLVVDAVKQIGTKASVHAYGQRHLGPPIVQRDEEPNTGLFIGGSEG